jgi:hypothetical protein
LRRVDLRSLVRVEAYIVAVLIRPHPQNAAQWEAIDIGRSSKVSIYPRSGANPLSIGKQNQYFDSIWHSDAVFGINTSAQVEAGLIGRPVFTVTDPTFEQTQGGTLHFHHLADPKVGLLHITASPAQHAKQLADVLALPRERRGERSAIFAGYFVRPYGPNCAATPRFVEAVETMQGLKTRVPAVSNLLGRAIRSLVLSRLTKVKLKRSSRGTLTSVQLRSDEGR